MNERERLLNEVHTLAREVPEDELTVHEIAALLVITRAAWNRTRLAAPVQRLRIVSGGEAG
ncbi:hypothetical protein ABQF35_00210 [Mycobacterium syngnathidarum]